MDIANSTNVTLRQERGWSPYISHDVPPEIKFVIEQEAEAERARATTSAMVVIQYHRRILTSLSLLKIHSVLSTLLAVAFFALAICALFKDQLWHPLFWLTGAFGSLGVGMCSTIAWIQEAHRLKDKKKDSHVHLGKNTNREAADS